MSLPLRWKILLFTVLPPVFLTAATLWTVNRSASRQVHSNVEERLWRSSLVFEDMLEARSEQLAVAAAVIVQDPGFNSILTLGASSRNPQFRRTVKGVASDFHAITRTDLFEVLDCDGDLLASVGSASSSPATRDTLVRSVLRRRTVSGILAGPAAQVQVAATPVVVGGRLVGVLLLGTAIDERLARELRRLTHSDVTFVSSGAVTASSFAEADREAALATLAAFEANRGDTAATRRAAEVRGRGQAYLGLVRPLPGAPPASQQLYVMQRSLVAETAYLGEIQQTLVELGLAAAALAVLAGFLIARRITGPVQSLVRGAEEMERGNFDHPLARGGRDEIGYLTRRFQEMRQHERAYVGRLEEADRLKSEFINVASHELRTPISVIGAYHEILSRGGMGPLTAEMKTALETIGRSLTVLGGVADEATRMTEIEGSASESASPRGEFAALVERAVAAARVDAPGRNVEIAVEVEPELSPPGIDAERIAEAIGHLARNGIRFTPDGGRVVVIARRDRDELLIVVRDEGIGMSEEKRDRLFRDAPCAGGRRDRASPESLEFNTTGAGRGLLAVREVVEAHRGTIVVESRPGKGSAFSIRLPYFPPGEMTDAA